MTLIVTDKSEEWIMYLSDNNFKMKNEIKLENKLLIES